MNKLTSQELEHLAEALDLLKRASAEELREVVESQDGEDERIASVAAIYRLQAHAVDITVNHITEEHSEMLKQAAQAEAKGDNDEAHRYYYAALHCIATTYSVESYHRNHDYIPLDVALHMLDKVAKYRRIYKRDEYEALEQDLVNDFLNL